MTPPADSAATMLSAYVDPRVGTGVTTVAVPQAGPGEARVRSVLVGICGSDTHALAGLHPFLSGRYIPGHEAVGIVDAVGAGVDSVRPGQRVLLKPNVACGRCANCRAGRTNACETLTWVGCDISGARPGAMAEYFVAPAGNLYPVPGGIDDRTAALIECLATPVHAAGLAGDVRAGRVVVLGAGTIGLLCVVAVLQAGARSVVVTDMEQGKIDRAVRCGALAGVPANEPDLTAQVRSALEGPADVVFDCVANEHSLRQAVGLVRRAATILVVGVPPRPAPVPLPELQDWELRLQGCAAYTETDIARSIEIAAAGALPTDELFADAYELRDVAAAFQAATANSSRKVMIGFPPVAR